MASVWLQSAWWLGLALLASLISTGIAVSVALIEIVVGAVAGNLISLPITDWVNFLSGFGAILLTFLAGTEIDPRIVRKHFWSSLSIGVSGFVAPYLGVLLYAHFVVGWPWPQAQIAGIALSTTSVAVVYAVIIETGFNKTEIGKIILAACFINDLGTVLALGVVFARYDLWLLLFGVATVIVLVILTRYAPWMFQSLGQRVSEPQTNSSRSFCSRLAEWRQWRGARRCCLPILSAWRWRRRFSPNASCHIECGSSPSRS
jgi:Kef-type K+ transport system membrane component KefB